MIDLGLNQYKIKEIKYEVKEGKTVVFKLNNFNLEDVVIETNDSEEYQKKYTEEPDYHPFSESEDYKPIKKETDADVQYKRDRNLINESIEEKEKEVELRLGAFGKVNVDKTKKIMNTIDEMPYKVYEKIGELSTNNNGEGIFITKPDPYVVNDERELPKQKNGQLSEEEIAALKASYNKEWEDSIKNKKIIPSAYMSVYTDLDKKYEGMSTGEKREISKKLIEKDAKEDSDTIKERISNSIGTNEPLSKEIISYPQKDFLKDKEYTTNYEILEKKLKEKIDNDLKKIKSKWADSAEKIKEKENKE